MKRTISILAVIVLGLMTACNTIDNNTEPQIPVVYTVSIPASFEGDAQTRAVNFNGSTSKSTFASTEKVYVYNATRYTMMLNAEGTAAGYLTPTNISADGKSCDLIGTITGAPIYPIDELLLLYNLNDIYADNDKDKVRLYSHYDYMRQDGTAAGVLDGAMATLTGWSISDGVLTTAGTARFVNLQSMFGLQFKDASTDAAISVKSLYITSKNDALIRLYYPMNTGTDQYYKSFVGPYFDDPISGDIYMSLFFDETCSADDVLTFHVKDAEGNKYEGTKAAPNGGFKNGKYYYLSAPIALTLTERRILPTIKWVTPSSAPETIDEEWIEIMDDNADFTLSGTSEGVCFILYKNGTVRLNGLTASYGADNDVFISGNYDITLDISGSNSISCKNYEMCVLAQDNLKLQGAGTLTVTANDASIAASAAMPTTPPPTAGIRPPTPMTTPPRLTSPASRRRRPQGHPQRPHGQHRRHVHVGVHRNTYGVSDRPHPLHEKAFFVDGTHFLPLPSTFLAVFVDGLAKICIRWAFGLSL